MRDRGLAFERFSSAVDGPMTVLALTMIPLILVPLVYELPAGWASALVAIDYLIWAAFAVEYAVKLWLAPDRWRFFKANIPDLVIVVVPMLRPLRLLRATRLIRLLRLARVVAFAVEGIHEARGILHRRGLSLDPPTPEFLAGWSACGAGLNRVVGVLEHDPEVWRPV